ncbi:hypothetical protein MUK42_06380 [Musa troglodytarum]|uniref:Uncharacterized protein n=1 Tax=Musa troglodytarum TaxID=320322 RepID=A0A9E7IHC3_9LILI|nr:hypothetical protein MUK42_06380 [Musa troglodytarum]
MNDPFPPDFSVLVVTKATRSPSSKWSYNSAGATDRAKQWWTRLLVMLHSRCLCRGRSCSHREAKAEREKEG